MPKTPYRILFVTNKIRDTDTKLKYQIYQCQKKLEEMFITSTVWYINNFI